MRRSTVTIVLLLVLATIRTGRTSDEVTVQGRVLDQYGRPVARARVTVGSQAAISGSDGRFMVQNVRLPYDAVHLGPPVVGYRGLTTLTPIVVVTLPNEAERWPIPIMGRVPVVNGEHVRLYFVAPGVSAMTAALDGKADYKFEFRWTAEGKGGAPGSVVALREIWKVPEPGVHSIKYMGIAHRLVTLTPESTTVINFTPADFESVRTISIRGRVVHPVNFKLQSITAYWESEGQTMFLSTLNSPMRPLGDRFDIVVPWIESATYTVVASAFASFPDGMSPHNGSIRGIRPSSEEVEVVLYPGPRLEWSLEGVTSVDSTVRFTWRKSPGPGIYALLVEPTELQGSPFGGRYRYCVYLADTSTTLEDLPVVSFDGRAGTGLMPGKQYVYTVHKLHSMSDMNEAASMAILANSSVSASRSILFTVRQDSTPEE